MEKTYICSREKFLELKQVQKQVVRSRKIESKDYRDYVKYRRLFYKSKGQQVPNGNDPINGFVYHRKPTHLEPQEVRYFNVIYALVKGRAYQEVESKVHEGNALKRFYVKKYCDKYGVDYPTIERLIWQTS